MTSFSLERQLVARIIVSGVIAAFIAFALLLWRFESSAEAVQDRGMQRLADQLGSSLGRAPDGAVTSSLSAETRGIFHEGLFATVSDQTGSVVLSVPAGYDHVYHPFEKDVVDHSQYFAHRYLGENENYLGVTQPIELGGERFWVQIVEEFPANHTLINETIVVFLKGTGPVLLAFVLAMIWIASSTARSALAAVNVSAMQARRIAAGDSFEPLPTDELPVEVLPLADAANSAIRRLRIALDAQKRFTADAAHELLTPIAILKSHVDTLVDTKRRYDIRADIDAVTDVVEQLLHLSELESEPGPPNTIVDLRDVAVDIVSMMAPSAIESGIELELVGAEEPLLVRGSAKALGRALRNLVENAIRHADGTTLIRVELHPAGSVEVIDDGRGIPADQRNAVFERFQRDTTSSKRGSGLGLAIVEQIVTAHGGDVSIQDPTAGTGARFVIRLPVPDG